jgi:hypothetical protein
LKKILPFVLLALMVGGIYGYLQYNKGHKDAKETKADIVISPKDLLNDFETDEASANAQYLDKLIETEGIIQSVDTGEAGSSVILETGDEFSSVICEMDENQSVKKLKVGQNVRLKGFCTGKLMDVVLVRCTLVE